MVATGWVCSEHMAEERVHFSGERKRESSKRTEKLRERIPESGFKSADSREGGEKCNLGI